MFNPFQNNKHCSRAVCYCYGNDVESTVKRFECGSNSDYKNCLLACNLINISLTKHKYEWMPFNK